ncbi:MAG: hypothetical protein CENE_02038 [Candidatus Celerinatantimonas neptuna]|nr:MAG: hypothetical protein CENE_02038 [Candidatus Celerinatantimonas neptuna]
MKQNRLTLNSEKLKSIIHRWWQSMMLSDEQLQHLNIPKAASGTRARLQRCQTLNDILITPDFQSLWNMLPDEYRQQASTQDMTTCALIAGVCVFIRNESEQSLATLAGMPDKKSKKPVVSGMRFARLQAARMPDDLLRYLRRTIKQLEQRPKVTALVGDIQQWMFEYHNPYPRKADERIRMKWSMDYFRAASSGK